MLDRQLWFNTHYRVSALYQSGHPNVKETDTETCHFHTACKVERWGAEGIQEGHVISSVECAQGLSLKRYTPVIQEDKKSKDEG